jgi:hypothetical protein
MDERERRIGLNEGVFREVNEQIDAAAMRFELADQPLDFVCECADPSCTERITMRHADYEELRAEPTHFAVFPGHETPGVEEVIARRTSYDIVRKYEPEPARLARKTDPRAAG